jgi:hypothetical protein
VSRPILYCAIALTCAAGVEGSSASDRTVLLRWDTQPGRLTIFEVALATRVDSHAATLRQAGRLTRLILDDPAPNQWNVAEMLELGAAAWDPAEPAGLAAGSPRPSSARTRFSVRPVTRLAASVGAPASSPFERELLEAVLDWGRWPDERVQPGDSWDRAFDRPALTGTQRIRLEQVGAKGFNELTAVLTVRADVRPRAGERAPYQVRSAGATVHWGVRSNRLLDAVARLAYVRRREGGEVVIQVEVRMRPTSRALLPAADHNRAARQVIALADMINAYRANQAEAARAGVRRFIRAWPDSRFRPVADFIAKRLAADAQAAAGAAASQPASGELAETLAGLLAQYRVAHDHGDDEALDACRHALEYIVRKDRTTLLQLTASEDAAKRAVGALALAFTGAPGDVATLVGLARDDDSAVRAAAFSALAIRASPLTSAEVLAAGVRDVDATVRAHACDAVAACVAPGTERARSLAGRLVTLLADRDGRVRSAAAEALAAIGTRDHLDALQRAIDREEDEKVRDLLKGAIRRLGERLDTTDPTGARAD